MASTDESTIRLQLRSLAERYASGVDRHDDVDGFVALFLPDAVIEIYDPSDAEEPRVVPSERIARIPQSIQRYAKTFHFLGQSTYAIGDGEATGEVYCIAHHLTPDQHGGTNYVMYIRYQDTYRPDADGVWKFAQRCLRVDWTETRAANPPSK